MLSDRSWRSNWERFLRVVVLFYTSGESSRIEEKGGKNILEISITLLIQEKVRIASGESPSVRFSSGVGVMTNILAGPSRVFKKHKIINVAI